MFSQTSKLVMARLVAFMYEASTLVVMAFIGVLVSPEFLDLIAKHFGEGLLGSFLVLAITGIVKHVRNISVANSLGSIEQTEKFYI